MQFLVRTLLSLACRIIWEELKLSLLRITQGKQCSYYYYYYIKSKRFFEIYLPYLHFIYCSSLFCLILTAEGKYCAIFQQEFFETLFFTPCLFVRLKSRELKKLWIIHEKCFKKSRMPGIRGTPSYFEFFPPGRFDTFFSVDRFQNFRGSFFHIFLFRR